MCPKCLRLGRQVLTEEDALCKLCFKSVSEEQLDPKQLTVKLRNPYGFSGVERNSLATKWEVPSYRLDKIPTGKSLDGDDYRMEQDISIMQLRDSYGRYIKPSSC